MDQRRLPRYPVAAARLARLGVDLRAQGRGLGESLLQDAVRRCLALRAELGIHVLLVDALHAAGVSLALRWQYSDFPFLQGEYLFPQAFVELPGVEWVML